MALGDAVLWRDPCSPLGGSASQALRAMTWPSGPELIRAVERGITDGTEAEDPRGVLEAFKHTEGRLPGRLDAFAAKKTVLREDVQGTRGSCMATIV